MSELNVPFDHPWQEDVLGNIGSVIVGGTPRTSVGKYWYGDVPWMVSGDVHLKRITNVPARITDLGLRSSNATLVDPPAVAVSLAGQGKTRGTVAFVLCRLCANQSVALIKCFPSRVVAEYLFYNLEFRYEELRSRSAGEGRAGLSKRILEQIPVSLPPLHHQAKIAEILSTVDRAIAQTKDLIDKQKRIKIGMMHDFLTRGIDEHGNLRTERTHKFKNSPLGRIPEEWKVGVGADCFTLRAGVEIEGARRSQEGDSLYLKVDDLNLPENLDGILVSQNTFYCPATLTARLLQTGTVVFPKRGAAIHLNRVALLRKRATLDPNLMGLCTKSGISPDFFRLVLLHRNLGTICDDSGIPQINNKHLYPLMFAIPDIDEQNRIVNCVHKSENLLRKHHMQLLKLRSLKTALMKDLLTKKPELDATGCAEIGDL